jgi:hypothetical protein
MVRNRSSKNPFYLLFVFVCLTSSTRGQQQQQPKISKFERDEVLQMLNTISDDVKKHYYDPKFHGIDWDENVKNFRRRIENAASLNRGLSEVAAAVDVLNDSHAFFLPPPRPYKHDYGWRIGMVGHQCMVLRVRPGSDGEKKGVKPGDEVMSINGFAPARDNLWKMNFVHNVLRPQAALRVSLRAPTGEKRTWRWWQRCGNSPKRDSLPAQTFGNIFTTLRLRNT